MALSSECTPKSRTAIAVRLFVSPGQASAEDTRFVTVLSCRQLPTA